KRVFILRYATLTTEIFPLALHDALPIFPAAGRAPLHRAVRRLPLPGARRLHHPRRRPLPPPRPRPPGRALHRVHPGARRGRRDDQHERPPDPRAAVAAAAEPVTGPGRPGGPLVGWPP